MKMMLLLIVPVSVLVAATVFAIYLCAHGNANMASMDARKLELNGGLTAAEVEQLIN